VIMHSQPAEEARPEKVESVYVCLICDDEAPVTPQSRAAGWREWAYPQTNRHPDGRLRREYLGNCPRCSDGATADSADQSRPANFEGWFAVLTLQAQLALVAAYLFGARLWHCLVGLLIVSLVGWIAIWWSDDL